MRVGGAALLYLLARLRLPYRKTPHKIDYLGAGVLAVAVTAIVLLTTWGGTQYAWRSAPIISLGVLAVAATVAYLVTETRPPEPVMPLPVSPNRTFSLACGTTFLPS